MDFEEIYKRKSGTGFEDRNYQEEIDEKISALKQHLEKKIKFSNERFEDAKTLSRP